MNIDQQALARWVIGIVATVVWFWGDKLQIPPQAQALAATIVPSLIGYVLGRIEKQPEGKA